MSCEVIITPTGATAMRDRASGEIMHPGTGNAVEPLELYVLPSRLQARLEAASTDGALVLFDVGLGAASNAIAAWRVSEALKATATATAAARRLEIVSFDNDLEPLRLALDPQHAESFGFTAGSAEHAAAKALLETGRHETARTTWRLAPGELLEALAAEADASADLVYWDMYSSKTRPDLWTEHSFRALRRTCRSGATMHTYSSATSVRTALLLGGFAVGAGGRTGDRAETTIAAVDVKDLAAPLDARFLERLARSTAGFARGSIDSDEGYEEALARVRGCPQFAGLAEKAR